MKLTLLTIPIVLSLAGCMSPDLCDTKKSVDNKTGLAPEHLEYFKNKPTFSAAESHATILPLAHISEHLQKEPYGYRHSQHVSLFGGLLLDGKYSENFDKEGKPSRNKSASASISILAGLLYEIDITASDKKDLNGSTSKSFLLKSFGTKQELVGSKYYTILWMPIKFSKSGKGEFLAPPPHTTGHAGPHPAVRKTPSDSCPP